MMIILLATAFPMSSSCSCYHLAFTSSLTIVATVSAMLILSVASALILKLIDVDTPDVMKCIFQLWGIDDGEPRHPSLFSTLDCSRPPNTSTYAPQVLSKAMAALIPVATG